MDGILASIFGRFWSIWGAKLGSKIDQKSIQKGIEKQMRKKKAIRTRLGGILGRLGSLDALDALDSGARWRGRRGHALGLIRIN